MGIVPVEKGQKLTAQAWNQLATTVNNIAGGSTAAASAGKVVQVTIRNRTDTAKRAGEILTVYKTGSLRLAQYTPDEARIAWMNNGFQLDGYTSGANGVPALLIDGIDEGGIGRALVYGLCAGYVSVSGSSAPDLVTFRASSGVFAVPSSGETGDWRVIASSSVSSGRVFAYLVPLGGGGGNYDTAKAVTNVTESTSSFLKSVSFDGNIAPITSIPNIIVSKAVAPVQVYLNQTTVPNGFVWDVTVDSNGDLVVTKVDFTLSAALESTPPTAQLSTQTSQAVTGLTQTKADFFCP